jgi:heat shock protein HslJ
MRIARLLVVLSLVGLSFVALFSLGCSGSSATLTSPSSLDLTAPQLPGTWSLVSIRPAGEAEQAKPSGASYTLTMVDGRLSTRADCNICGGTYTLNGQTLTAGPSLACTRAACPTMAFESTYMKLLGGESTVSLSGGTLELTSPRGVLRFTR